MSKPVIVIGGGQHGLTAAATLAKAGRKVLLLEANEALGGLARREEFIPGFHTPGLLHDTTCLQGSVVRHLKLESQGLTFQTPAIQTIPSSMGPIYLGESSAEGAISERDVAAYAELQRFLRKLRKPLGRMLQTVPPSPLGPVSALLRPALSIRGLGADDMVELLRAPSMCVADWMRDVFESEEVMGAVAHSSLIGSFAGPWSPWTAANLLFEGAAKGSEVKGGPAALVDALEKSCRSLGVDIRAGVSVSAIRTERGSVVGVTLANGEEVATDRVLSTCDPKTTFLDLVGRRNMSDRLAGSIANIRMRGMTAKLNVALTGELLDSGGKAVALYRSGVSLDALEQAYDAAKYGEMSENPMLDVRAFAGAAFAPEGSSVLSILVHFAPYHLKGGWTTDARTLLETRAMAMLEQAFPGTAERVVGSSLLVPVDIEKDFRCSEGHIFHGEHAPDQQLFMRPTIETANYGTPIHGLYVGGSGSHPGGGITCGAGHLAAKALLATG